MELQLQQVSHQQHIPYTVEPVTIPKLRVVENEVKMESKPFVPQQARKHFIEANTKEVTMYHLKNDCIVPVFSKDNEITISHNNFIETVWESANRLFRNETITEPDIRVSHVIKGRTPDAIYKNVKELTDSDKTIYYERMMFCIRHYIH